MNKILSRILLITVVSFIYNLHTCLSQSNKVTIHVNNGNLIEILNEIKKQTGYEYLVNNEHIRHVKNITINIKNSSIEEVLKKCLQGYDLDFKIEENVILIFFNSHGQKGTNRKEKFTISGTVRSKVDGESLIGANVYLIGQYTGVITNSYGFYSLTLTEGNYTINYSYIGFKPEEKQVELNKNIMLNIELEESSVQLEQIVVSQKAKNDNIVSSQSGKISLNYLTMKQTPVLMGEMDVVRTLKLLPGIQSTNETSSGISVRGGTRDQNLVLLDEATVYNVAHLMGIFSVFNGDAIKSIDLYKGSIPAQYGGRLASVIDIRMNEGNAKQLSMQGSLGAISSHFSIEAPLLNHKGSFMISGRRSYADLFLPLVKKAEIRNSKLFFYDLNLKSNIVINERNRLYISGYLGKDFFKYEGKDFSPGLSWGNNTETFRWNHIFNQKVFSNFSFIRSNYDFAGASKGFLNLINNEVSGSWIAKLQDYSAKIDISIYPNPRFTFKLGMQSTYHQYHPGKATLIYDTVTYCLEIPESKALEFAVYINIKQKLAEKLEIEYGLRPTAFQNIGKATVYKYSEDYNVIDSTSYRNNKIYNTYLGIEPRFSMAFIISSSNSIKAAYARTRQYVQLASNSTAGTPIDAWIPSSPNLKPQISDQYSLGYFKNFLNNKFESSIELYYKNLKNQIDFKDGADLLLNNQIESQIRTGNGKAYGMEFYFQKKVGKVTGWISYTLSRSERRIKGINNNQTYLSPFDRPHNLNIIFNYNIIKRLDVSFNFVYYSGTPFTSPTGRYEYGKEVLPLYTGRNGDRMPDYHRADISITLYGKDKPVRKVESSWNLSVYNVYNKKNPTIIYFTNDFFNKEKTSAKMIYVLPIIPSISYNFKF